MRDQILNLIKNKPKHYSSIIQRDQDLKKWVLENTKIINGNWAEQIYSAITGLTGICKFGKKQKFNRISTGFTGCGPAAVCACTKENIASAVSESKQKYTTEQKKKINQTREQTMLDKYGVSYNSQRVDIKHCWTKPKISTQSHEKLVNKNWMYDEYVLKQRSLVDLADELGVYYSTVGYYCRFHGFSIRQRSQYSLTELEVCDFLKSLGIAYEHGNWDVLGREIDVYVPSKKLGIEINGLYWHSFHPTLGKPEDRIRHLIKYKLAESAGISLLQFTDQEWREKNLIVKSIICSKLGLNQRIYARKCKLLKVDKKTEKLFLNSYHIQGYVNSEKAVGLYYNNELVCIMSVGANRFSKNHTKELLRFCSKSGITVVGGGSKLITEIMKDCNFLTSYCDLSKSTGQSYIKLGFSESHITAPSYFYTDGNIVISRFKAQKKQLSKWLLSYDSNKSESENMFDAGYRRYHDCGNKVFIYTRIEQ